MKYVRGLLKYLKNFFSLLYEKSNVKLSIFDMLNYMGHIVK